LTASSGSLLVPAEAANSAPKKMSSRPLTSCSLTSAGSWLKARCQNLALSCGGRNSGGVGGHAREGGLGDDQAIQPVSVIGGHGVGDRHAGVVAVLGLVGQPDAALVDRNHLEVPGQGRHEHPPGVPGLRPAVDQQQRRPVTADHDVQAQRPDVDIPAGEGVGEPFREVRRPETEPGPSGMGRLVEAALMRIPFSRRARPTSEAI
jgi:hypothetical protein